MAYNFGNIFVQAMENQKRLATQRQQFDAEMDFRDRQLAQQDTQFQAAHEIDKRRVNIEEARGQREQSYFEADKVADPNKLMGQFGYEPDSFGRNQYYSQLQPWANHGLLKGYYGAMMRNMGQQVFNPISGRYSTIPAGADVPAGSHPVDDRSGYNDWTRTKKGAGDTGKRSADHRKS
jgi:hypothetical protein